MAFDSDGFLYLANYSDHSILKIDYDTSTVQRFIGGLAGHDDGPCATATTKWPNYLCLTPEGDLFWTEHMDSKVRYALRAVPPFVPKIQDTFQSFEERLDTLIASDTPISAPQWTHPIFINKDIISTACGTDKLFDLDLFTSGNIKREVTRTFFAILYGQHTAPNPEAIEECASYLRALQFIHNLPFDDAWRQHTDILEVCALRSLSLLSLIHLVELVSTDLTHTDRVVQLLASRIRTIKDEQMKEKLKSELATKISPELFNMLFGTEDLPLQLVKITKQTPLPLNLSMRTLGERLYWTVTSELVHGPSHAPTNFVISNGSGNVLPVHDWVLYTRWPYFRSLIDSGLSEALSGSMELSSYSIPSSALLQLVRYIYYGTVFDEDKRHLCFDSVSDCEWVLENGAMFSIFSDIEHTQPNSGFGRLVHHCKKMFIVVKSESS